MTKKKIRVIAEFLYSSNSSNDVPLRLSCSTGQFTGFDLSKELFIELMEIFNNSVELKKDLSLFRDKYE